MLLEEELTRTSTGDLGVNGAIVLDAPQGFKVEKSGSLNISESINHTSRSLVFHCG